MEIIIAIVRMVLTTFLAWLWRRPFVRKALEELWEDIKHHIEKFFKR